MPLRAELSAPPRRDPRGRPSTRLRTGSRARGGALLRGRLRARRRGAVTGHTVKPQPVPAGWTVGPGRSRIWVGGCSSTPRALGTDARKSAPGQHRCWPRLSRGCQGPALSVFLPPLGALDAGPGVGRAVPSSVTAIANPKALLASLRRRCQGHRDWMSARFCPGLDRLKPLGERVI